MLSRATSCRGRFHPHTKWRLWTGVFHTLASLDDIHRSFRGLVRQNEQLKGDPWTFFLGPGCFINQFCGVRPPKVRGRWREPLEESHRLVWKFLSTLSSLKDALEQVPRKRGVVRPVRSTQRDGDACADRAPTSEPMCGWVLQ